MARTNLPNLAVDFCAYRTTDLAMTSSNAIMIFDAVEWNNGGAYNTSTGIFTAPYTGKYLFTVRVTSGSAQTLNNVYLSIGGNRSRDMLEAISFTTNTEFSSTAELNLTAGDQVALRHLSGTFTYQGGNNNFYTQLQGRFLGGTYNAA